MHLIFYGDGISLGRSKRHTPLICLNYYDGGRRCLVHIALGETILSS